ncbi:MAG: guanylate kinase, partial [Atopostipes suicloacalis]|nr:guanylate kinase [Atopostipes suicloacalis]
MANKKIIILVGPSGSGKTSIGKVLEEKSIPRLITTTTRKARVGEIDGRDYYFEDIVNMNLE